MSNIKTKRLFIAFNLPENVKEYLSKAVNALKGRNREVKWVNSESLHLTLHFLGEVSISEIGSISKLMSGAVKASGPMEFELGEINAFPNLNSARVIFIECRQINGSASDELQKFIGKELEKSGFEIEKRPWKTHITIGRNKGFNSSIAGIDDSTIEPIRFSVNSVDLMESELTRQGAVYKIVFSAGLES